MRSNLVRTMMLGGWLVASTCGAAILAGCAHEHHAHHEDIVIRDDHGWVHKGYYDEHHDWHGGYYDEHQHYNPDPREWHGPYH